jgi:hypothetical protein
MSDSRINWAVGVLRLFLMGVALVLIPGPSMGAEGRTLGGYRFIPASKVEDPFITHHFRNSTGVSIASNVDVPIIIINTTPPDTLLSLNGNLLFVGANFGYQHVVHPRVAVHVFAGALSRIGTSGQALLSQGVTALTSSGLGTTVELWRNERVLLSGLLNVGHGQALVVNLVKFAEDVIESGPENASILTTDEGGTIDGGLALAWAPNPWSGVTAFGQIGYSRIETRDDDLLWRLAGTGSVDFGQRDQAPVGLLLTVDIDRLKPKSVAGGTAVAIGGGIFYTGREDINLGLEIHWMRFTQFARDVTIHPMSFDLVLRYYF